MADELSGDAASTDESGSAGADAAAVGAGAAESAGGGGEATGREWLPESFREDPSFANVDTPATLAERYSELKRLQGSSIRLPGKDTTPEQRAQFFQKFKDYGEIVMLNPDDEAAMSDLYGKLGRPESADGYAYDEVKFPEGMGVKTEVHDALKGIAHKVGLSAAQYRELANGFNQLELARATQWGEKVGATVQALKQSWGDAYDARMGITQQFLAEMAPEEQRGQLAQELDNAGLSNSPVFAQAIYNMAKKFGEPTLIAAGSERPGTGSLDEMRAQHAEIMANPAYRDQSKPNHNALVQKASSLMERIVDTERRISQSAA